MLSYRNFRPNGEIYRHPINRKLAALPLSDEFALKGVSHNAQTAECPNRVGICEDIEIYK